MRSEPLAQRVLEGHQGLISFIESCTEEDWKTWIPNEERPVGVLMHHVASMLPVELEFIKMLASGKGITDINDLDVHQMNTQHADANVDRTRDETRELLKHNSELIIATIRELSDEQLDRVAPVSLHWDSPVSTQYFIEEHPLNHSYHHLDSIRTVLGS